MAKKADYFEWLNRAVSDGYEGELIEWIQSYLNKATPPEPFPYGVPNCIDSIKFFVEYYSINNDSDGVRFIVKIRNAWKQRVRRRKCLDIAQTIEISKQAKSVLQTYAKQLSLSQNTIVNEAILKFGDFHKDISALLNKELKRANKLQALKTDKYRSEINHLRDEVARLTSENNQLRDERKDKLEEPIREE